jgi:hypothetical protein
MVSAMSITRVYRYKSAYLIISWIITLITMAYKCALCKAGGATSQNNDVNKIDISQTKAEKTERTRSAERLEMYIRRSATEGP